MVDEFGHCVRVPHSAPEDQRAEAATWKKGSDEDRMGVPAKCRGCFIRGLPGLDGGVFVGAAGGGHAVSIGEKRVNERADLLFKLCAGNDCLPDRHIPIGDTNRHI